MYSAAGKTVPFGHEGKWLYVNSAHSVSCNWVDQHFKEANARGAVPLSVVAEELGVDRIDDLIVGGVALRRYVEDKLLELTGRRYSRVGANKIVSRMEFCGRWRALPVTFTNSADAALITHLDEARRAHARALKSARAAKNSAVRYG